MYIKERKKSMVYLIHFCKAFDSCFIEFVSCIYNNTDHSIFQ
ncbi:hypothetical protein CLOSTMETH_00656 [[Clostridium] methylpentosum DSM 5476]|uniref:Uncharacterized protein n=1 Tax=[Clostridium] methylpentosum DSM 5476 TaxID=537013 RepID=C0EA02_9FIRM|nr:hypothetical protein CLOSTMETH_00656 [[Clostridium] methylpentosum DSM 5476]